MIEQVNYNNEAYNNYYYCETMIVLLVSIILISNLVNHAEQHLDKHLFVTKVSSYNIYKVELLQCDA